MIEAATLRVWRDAAQRGLQWLAEQTDRHPPLGADAGDLNWFAKQPWALAACGDRLRALRLVRHVQHHILIPNKLHAPAQTNWTNAVPYALGWIIPGARQCEAYDAARLLYAEFQPYVCSATGGTFSLREHRNDPNAWFDLGVHGAALHAAAVMGDLSLARKAGRFLIDAIRNQPEPKRRLYLLYHPSRGYLRQPDDALRMQCVLEADKPRQVFANFGFGLHGLIRVSEVTGDTEYLDAAREVIDLMLDHYNPDWLTFSQNHKVGHVAMLLHRHTREKRYLDAALGIAARVAQRLQPDGRALADLMFDDVNRQSPLGTLRTTCDSVLWLTCICDELESGVMC